MLENFKKGPFLEKLLSGKLLSGKIFLKKNRDDKNKNSAEKFSLLFDKLPEGAKAFLTSEIFKNCKKDILIISGGVKEDLFIENLNAFTKNTYDFPSYSALIDKNISPSPDVTGDRFTALDKISQDKDPKIVITSLQGALQKTLSTDLFQKSDQYNWKKGDDIDFSNMPMLLEELGYKRSSVVSDKKEYALRGGIVDIFSVSANAPYRIEFFGDTIESIREFDPISQKTVQKIDEATISIANETDVIKKSNSFLIDYLKNPIIFFDDLLAIEDTYVNLIKLIEGNANHFISFENFLKKIENNSKVFFAKQKIEALFDISLKKKDNFFEKISFDLGLNKIEVDKCNHPFLSFENFISFENVENDELTIYDQIENLNKNKIECFFFYERPKEKKLIEEKLNAKNIFFNPHNCIEKYISSSFVIADSYTAFVSFSDFFYKKKIRRQKQRSTYHSQPSEFHKLEPGDLVVHFHSGIGKYIGTEKHKNHLGQEDEFLIIEYTNSSKLFLPISQAYLVSKYIGSSESNPTLSTLGSSKWQKTKLNAQKQIVGYAGELIELYAKRSEEKGFAYPKDSEEIALFEEEFPYEETPDQLSAISDIKKDMLDKKPMERLICGDVGYGKTEVAMRAAFKAVCDGNKQVAILVPTTILAMQHFDSFKERMKEFGVNVEVISRFNTPKKNREVLEKVTSGTIDILIGTHRLLSKDVSFNNLGLIIIDEEQRFGVRAKEHLKKMKTTVDSLTLSATPIPRTLYMSLIKTRDMSVISTPPQDRLPIKTIMAVNEDQIIRNAVLAEMAREGQTFFIHNRVESIYQRKDYIQKLIPHAKILVAHGQLPAKEIDFIFHEFKRGNADLLLTTTIVENGVDIPNANTILIDHADTFGLADLYQLRGRVGRWNRAAYAYLLTAKNKNLTDIAKKRLSSLMEASGHGGGLKIAMRDLEIRGAGDILGIKQSGQVSEIGFHLYCKLLKKALSSLKQKTSMNFIETRMEFSYPAYIPDFYIDEISLKMEIYHRLGEAENDNEIDEIALELKDRFGPVPKEVNWLLELAKIKIFAQQNQISTLKFTSFTLNIQKIKGKKTYAKSILLPKQIQNDPSTLRIYVISNLLKK